MRTKNMHQLLTIYDEWRERYRSRLRPTPRKAPATARMLLLSLLLGGLSTCIFSIRCDAQCNTVPAATAPVTVDDEATTIPNSRQLVNGTNSTVDTSTPGQIKIDVSSSAALNEPITVDNETSTYPNSRQLVNGTNTTVDTGTAGQIKIDVSGLPTVPAVALNGCRLTLQAGAPAPASVTAATTLHFVPYKSQFVTLDTSSGLVTDSVGTGISISLSGLTAGKVYDVFAYDNAGTPTLSLLAWTNTTTRATGLAYDSNGGFLIESGTSTNRYLGSIYISATGQSEDTYGDRALYNYDNRIPRSIQATIPTASWAYSSSTIRAADGNTTNGQGRISFLSGVVEDVASCRYSAQIVGGSGAVPTIGVGFNGLNFYGAASGGTTTSSEQWLFTASLTTLPGLGYNYFQATENSNGDSVTFYGNAGTEFGMAGFVMD